MLLGFHKHHKYKMRLSSIQNQWFGKRGFKIIATSANGVLEYDVHSFFFGIFGMSMVGANIWDFYPAHSKELCNRWIEVSALYPFSRDYWSVISGVLIARPLFFSFINYVQCYGFNTQFLLGSSLMSSLVLEQEKKEVYVLSPSEIWYNLHKLFTFILLIFISFIRRELVVPLWSFRDAKMHDLQASMSSLSIVTTPLSVWYFISMSFSLSFTILYFQRIQSIKHIVVVLLFN